MIRAYLLLDYIIKKSVLSRQTNNHLKFFSPVLRKST